MTSADKIQDFRRRLVEADALRLAGSPVPPGLVPTEEEISSALLAIRLGRENAEAEGKTRRKSPSALASEDFDLDRLF